MTTSEGSTVPADMSRPRTITVADGDLRIFANDASEGDLSAMYVLDVLGVSVSVYVNGTGTHVHIDTIDATSGEIATPISFEVNNDGAVEIEATDD